MVHAMQRQQPADSRFGSLILINLCGMQPIKAAARGEVVDHLMEVIATKEPGEALIHCNTPPALTRCQQGLVARFHQRCDFNRLLVKPGLILPTSKPAIVSNKRKVMRERIGLDI